MRNDRQTDRQTCRSTCTNNCAFKGQNKIQVSGTFIAYSDKLSVCSHSQRYRDTYFMPFAFPVRIIQVTILIIKKISCFMVRAKISFSCTRLWSIRISVWTACQVPSALIRDATPSALLILCHSAQQSLLVPYIHDLLRYQKSLKP